MANNDQYGGEKRQANYVRPSNFSGAAKAISDKCKANEAACHILAWNAMVKGYQSSLSGTNRAGCLSNLAKLFTASALDSSTVIHQNLIDAACQNANRFADSKTDADNNVLRALYNSADNLFCGWKNTNSSIQEGLDIPCANQAYTAATIVNKASVLISGQPAKQLQAYLSIVTPYPSPPHLFKINQQCTSGTCNDHRLQSSSCEGDNVANATADNFDVFYRVNGTTHSFV